MFSANSSQVTDDKLFVEDVFSTYLYTGNGGTQTITNGIDLAGKGGLVWVKNRTTSAYDHYVVDTVTGNLSYPLATNSTRGKTFDFTPYSYVSSLNSNGFSLAVGAGDKNDVNASGQNYASWTFREAPKFFDIVTYTGNSTSGGPTRTLSHNLGVAPGMVIIKCTTTGYAWVAWHRSAAGNGYLNTTAAFADDGYGITVTATTVSFVAGNGATNANGDQYVMYLFAHDTASDGLIQCGLFTGDGTGSSAANALGWEPQVLLIKRIDSIGDWQFFDSMRGFSVGTTATNLPAQVLYPNLASAEVSVTNQFGPTAKGFLDAGYGAPYQAVYIAIRRGPMRTPTLGTSVFAPSTRTGTGTTTIVSSTTFPPDLLITKQRTASEGGTWFDRLRGRAKSLLSSGTGAELTTTTTTNDLISFNMNGITVGANAEAAVNTNGAAIVDWNFRRAPGFMDEVCYTGTGVLGRTVAHNLGVAPEMIIVKRRSAANDWGVYHSALGNTKLIYLNYNLTPYTAINWWNNTTPTASVFTVGDQNENNASGSTYVSYLFASCPGVSKVGSYTGNGSSQTINCAFAAGARFVMIKRTDSTGDWYVWDTARGIVAGNDPHLSLNTTAAEVTTDDTIDTDSSGFVVNQVAATNVNVNAATYIYLAIA